MLMRPYAIPAWEETAEQLTAMAAMGRRISAGDSGLADDLAEVQTPLPEMLQEVPEGEADRVRQSVATMTRAQEALNGSGPAGLPDLLSPENLPGGEGLPEGFPTGLFDTLRTMVGYVADLTLEVWGKAAQDAAGGAAIDPESILLLEMNNPGTLRRTPSPPWSTPWTRRGRTVTAPSPTPSWPAPAGRG